MAELKLFHKILIIIAVIWILSKLATVKLSQIIPRRTPREPVTRYVQPSREPEQRTVIRECVPMPVQPATLYAYARGRESRPVPPMPAPSAAVVMEETLTESSAPASVHIDDATFNRFFG
jgi:hypothetical protein